jgi:5'-nucleotidase
LTASDGERLRVLVTNDDGVEAPGLAALARAVVAMGHDVVVAAPLRDQSGSGAAIAPAVAEEGIRVSPGALEGVGDVAVHGVDGPPALAVMAARLGGLGRPPSLVASGVNLGPNTGYAVLHSGTVGAALTAANFGASGLAVSLDSSRVDHLTTAAAVAQQALSWLAGAPARTVLNVNVPDLPLERLAGVRWAPLANFGQVQAAMREGDGGRLQVEIKADEHERTDGTDTALLAAGFVTVTSIVGVQATAENDAPLAIEAGLSTIA